MEKYKLQEYEPLWNNWYVDELIGEGSFGSVYRIKREEFGTTHYSALKILSIPKQESEIKDFYAEGMTKNDTQTYLKGIVEDIYNEIVLMTKLKGKSNIVSYEDHQIIENKDGVGYYILIRMELLKSLNDFVMEQDISNEQIVKMGKDICQALILCQRQNILHRDIKPDNIFVSEDGDFKLGDFGIAKKVEDYQMGMSMKGSFKYMAPEVYKGGEYDERVDIYSLGIVLYSYLNDKKIPFLDVNSKVITYSQRQEALRRRFHGEKIPKPIYASDKLADVILKAIEFYPEQRYSSAMEFLEALNTVNKEEIESPIEKRAGDNSITEGEETVLLVNGGEKTEKKDFMQQTVVIEAGKEGEDTDDSTVVLSDEKIKQIQNEELDNKIKEVREEPIIKEGEKEEKRKKKFFVNMSLGIIGGICVIGAAASLLTPKIKQDNKPEATQTIPQPEKTALIESTREPIQSTKEPKITEKPKIAEKPKITKEPENIKLIEVDVSNKNKNTLRGIKQLDYKNIITVSVLNASNNKLKDISILKEAVNLKSLDLSMNEITDISSLKVINKLEILKLQSNKIDSIDALAGLVKVKHLDLSENADLKEISKLKGMVQLEFLSLKGTKVSEKEVEQLKKEIPNCIIIDKDGNIHG